MGRIGAAWTLGGFIVACIAARAVSALAGDAAPPDPESIRRVFQRVVPSVVSIRARSSDVLPGTQTRFTETGSGVLVTADGKVLTATHLVYAMDEITVEFVSGDRISARVIASQPVAGDLSLLQLERVPLGSTVSPMADARTIRSGQEAFIVGAPYRRPHILSIGAIREGWPPNAARRTVPLVEIFQSDAVSSVPSSGAPLFNVEGEVVGIVSRNLWSGDGGEAPDFVVTLNAGPTESKRR